MNVTKILSFGFELELPESFNERHAFNIAHRPTKLKKTMTFRIKVSTETSSTEFVKCSILKHT